MSRRLRAIDPRLRALAARQIDEVEAIDPLGDRLRAYARIDLPNLLLGVVFDLRA